MDSYDTGNLWKCIQQLAIRWTGWRGKTLLSETALNFSTRKLADTCDSIICIFVGKMDQLRVKSLDYIA
jgi:hypothetical protein